MTGFVNHTYHFDSQHVADVLIEAEALIDINQIARDLRPAAFTAAVQLLTARFSTMEQVSPAGVVLSGQGG